MTVFWWRRSWQGSSHFINKVKQFSNPRDGGLHSSSLQLSPVRFIVVSVSPDWWDQPIPPHTDLRVLTLDTQLCCDNRVQEGRCFLTRHIGSQVGSAKQLIGGSLKERFSDTYIRDSMCCTDAMSFNQLQYNEYMYLSPETASFLHIEVQLLRLLCDSVLMFPAQIRPLFSSNRLLWNLISLKQQPDKTSLGWWCKLARRQICHEEVVETKPEIKDNECSI